MKINELPKWVLPTAVGVVSGVAGAAAGYLYARSTAHRIKAIQKEVEEKQLELEFNVSEFERTVGRLQFLTRTIADNAKKIREATDEPVRLPKINEPKLMQTTPYLYKTLDQLEPLREYEPLPEVEPRVEYDPPDENGMVIGRVMPTLIEGDDWDWDYELSRRNPEKPYVLTYDEFMADEMGIQDRVGPETVTYYSTDHVLCDMHDRPILDPGKMIGPLMFGHGSGDPMLFYVRNEKEDFEWEVVLDDGSYEEQVLGSRISRDLEDQDVKHSRRPLKFRDA